MSILALGLLLIVNALIFIMFQVGSSMGCASGVNQCGILNDLPWIVVLGISGLEILFWMLWRVRKDKGYYRIFQLAAAVNVLLIVVILWIFL